MGNQRFYFHVSLNLVSVWLDWGILDGGESLSDAIAGEGEAIPE